MRFEFSSLVTRWEARRDLWTFVTVPAEASAEIAELAATMPRSGFGAVRVRARIGGSRWTASVFPGGDGLYSLAVKSSIRRAESISLGDEVRVAIELVDF